MSQTNDPRDPVENIEAEMPTIGVLKEVGGKLQVHIPVVPGQIYVGLRLDSSGKGLLVAEPYFIAANGSAILLGPAADQAGIAKLHIGHFFGHVLGIDPEDYLDLYKEGKSIADRQRAEWQQMAIVADSLPPMRTVPTNPDEPPLIYDSPAEAAKPGPFFKDPDNVD